MMPEASLMKTMIAVVALCLCPSMLFSQLKPTEATPATKTKEADMTVLGIRLGEKLSIPECKREQDRTFPYGFGIVPPSFICFQRRDVRTTEPNAPVDTDAVAILLPDKDRPLVFYSDEVVYETNRRAAIVGQIVDGQIEAVTIYTVGFQAQDAVLAMLKEKYGEPSSFEEKSKENAFGAVFSSHLVQWLEFTNLKVVFEATLERTDIGSIDIMTIKGAKYLSEQAQQKIQAGPKL
jgi:hypothetical protein